MIKGKKKKVFSYREVLKSNTKFVVANEGEREKKIPKNTTPKLPLVVVFNNELMNLKKWIEYIEPKGQHVDIKLKQL